MSTAERRQIQYSLTKPSLPCFWIFLEQPVDQRVEFHEPRVLAKVIRRFAEKWVLSAIAAVDGNLFRLNK